MTLSVGVHTQSVTTNATLTETTPNLTTQGAGSEFVVGLVWSTAGGQSVSSVTDSKGNTYTQIGSPTGMSGADASIAFYRCENGIGGATHNWTVTWSDFAYKEIYVLEIIGALTSGSLDQSGAQSDSSSPFTSPSITTTQADAMLVSLIGTHQTGDIASFAEGTGFTIHESHTTNDNWCGGIATRIVNSIGTYNSSWTGTNIDFSAVFIAALKAAAAGGTILRQMIHHYYEAA